MKLYSLHTLPLLAGLGPVFLDGAPGAFDAAEASRALERQLGNLAHAGDCGFDGLVLQERHAERGSGLVSAALAAATIAARVPRLRLMLHGLPLPLKDPHLWAEELAWLDLATGGRIEASFAVGDGPTWWTAPGWPAHAREKFSEALSLLARAQTEPLPLRHEGLHYSYRLYLPTVRPLQASLPLAIAGGDAFLQAEAGRVGWSCLALDASRAAQTDLAREQGRAGHAAWLGAFVHVGADAAGAADAAGSLDRLRDAAGAVPPQWLAPPGLVGADDYAALIAGAEPLPRPTFIGSADEVSRALAAWRDEAGASHLALCFEWPGLGDDAARASMARFAADVMPGLRA